MQQQLQHTCQQRTCWLAPPLIQQQQTCQKQWTQVLLPTSNSNFLPAKLSSYWNHCVMCWRMKSELCLCQEGILEGDCINSEGTVNEWNPSVFQRKSDGWRRISELSSSLQMIRSWADVGAAPVPSGEPMTHVADLLRMAGRWWQLRRFVACPSPADVLEDANGMDVREEKKINEREKGGIMDSALWPRTCCCCWMARGGLQKVVDDGCTPSTGWASREPRVAAQPVPTSLCWSAAQLNCCQSVDGPWRVRNENRLLDVAVPTCHHRPKISRWVCGGWWVISWLADSWHTPKI